MIFFGHLGLTTLAFKAYEKKYSESSTPVHKELASKSLVDYRFVLIGAVLPDIIDKPIGMFFFRGTFHNSRIFAHTLLFSIILLAIGTWLHYKLKNNSVLIMGISCLIHLILDSMWLYTAILFWPLFGFRFPERPEGDWIKNDFLRLITDPSYFLPELIGFIIIAYFFIRLLKNKQVKAFLKKGKL